MKRFTEDGKQLFKCVTVRIFSPGNKKWGTRRHYAPPGRAITEQGVTEILDREATLVEKTFPQHEYRLVKLGPNRFNFVWECERASAHESLETVAAGAQ